MPKKRQLDNLDVVLIIESERRKRIRNFWQLFFAWTFTLILIALFVWFMYFAIVELYNDTKEQNYEKMCSAKLQGMLEGMLEGKSYSFDECFLVANDDIENKDIATCSCYYWETSASAYPWFQNVRIKLNLKNLQ